MKADQCLSKGKAEYAEMWNTIVKETNCFALPLHCDRRTVPPLVHVSDINVTLTEMSRANDASSRASIRAYTHGNNNHALEEAVLTSPPDFNDDLAGWFFSIFPQEESALIINRAERWNDSLARRLAVFMEPLGKHYTFPPLEWEITFFAGNYSATPFGIHVDRETDAFHFVLGPASRSLFLLTPQEFELYKARERVEQHTLVGNYGREYVLRPGDWFMLPARKYYHLAANKGFCVSLAIALFSRTPESFYGSAARQNGLSAEQGTVLWKHPTQIDDNGAQFIIHSATPSYLDAAFLRLKSNQGLRASPEQVETSDVLVRDNATIGVSHPFQIVFSRVNDTLETFVRGHNFCVQYHQDIVNLYEFLNRGSASTVGQLSARYRKGLTRGALVWLLVTLWRLRAIDISPPPKRQLQGTSKDPFSVEE